MKIKKQSKKNARERGAVMLISVYAATVFLLLTAMLLDFGLFYYKQARLQNAVDSAATAVASELGATDDEMKEVAKNYLKKNGFEYDDDKTHINIELKGTLSEEAAEADEYISSGYLKLSVKIDSGTIFGPILGIDSLMLHQDAFVKVNANYTDMPRALNYTLFAGSSVGSTSNPAMKINGRTGQTINTIASSFESFINGINEKIVQPVIGIFGGEENYTDLVHINLSEAMTNGDVHSNSNINIGIQAVNASRTKDGQLASIKTDSDGNYVTKKDSDGNTIYKTDDDGNYVYQKVYDEDGNVKLDEDGNEVTEKVPIYEYESYSQDASGNNAYNDYGQVTYTAVDDITFKSTSADSSTHAYVQNQQKLEQTQTALTILNLIDFDTVSSTETLKAKYTEEAENYLESKGSMITESQQTAIEEQVDNITYSDGVVYLNDQEMLVYDISRDNANAMLEVAESDTSDENSTSSVVDGVTIIKSKLIEQLEAKGEDKLYSEGTTLLFQNIADELDEDGVSYTTTVGSTDTKVTVEVSGTRVNRDYGKTSSQNSDFVGSDYSSNAISVNAKYAVYQTFQENLGESGHITTPNMKPYFIRQTNKSIANSTKTKDNMGSSSKGAVTTVKTAVANASSDLQEILDDTSYTDDTYEGDNFSKLTQKDTSPLFTRIMETKSGGLTKLTGDDHTTYNGYELYNEEDVLKSPAEFVKEFKSENITLDDNNESKYGTGAINKYYNDNVDGEYADDAVQAKKKQISGSSSSVDDKKSEVKADGTYTRLENMEMPTKTDVFLVPKTATFRNLFTKYNEFEEIINDFTEFDTAETGDTTADFDISDYMPTVDTSSKTVTACENALFADGSSTISGLSTASSAGKGDVGGKWITGDISNTSSNSTSMSSNTKTVVQGKLYTKSKNMDVKSGATLVVCGDAQVGGDFQIRENSVVFVFGNITCSNLLLENGARLYCSGTITVNTAATVNGTSDSEKFSGVLCGSSMYYASATLGSSSDSSYSAVIQSSNSITTGGAVNIYGNSRLVSTQNAITISGTLGLYNTAKVFAYSSFSATMLSNSTKNNVIQAASVTFTQTDTTDAYSVYCRIESYGDVTFNCFVTIQSDAVLLVQGNLNFNGRYKYKSVLSTKTGETTCDIYGKIYVWENVNAQNRVDFYSGTLYCCGNFSAATNDDNDCENAIVVRGDGASTIYVGGQIVTSTSNKRHIWIYEGSDTEATTFSVFGYVEALTNSKPFDSQICEFCNQQSNSYVYFGDGRGLTSSNAASISFTNSLQNYGNLYCYGSISVLNSDADVILDGEDNVTYIAGKLSLGTDSGGGSITVTNGHILRVGSNINVKSGGITLSGGSKVFTGYATIAGALTMSDSSYFITTSTLTSGSVALSGGSKLWVLDAITTNGSVSVESDSADNKSEFFSYKTHTDTTTTKSLTINGIYITPNSDDDTFATLYVKQYGEFSYLGAITITSKLQVDDGGYLYLPEKVTLNGGTVQNGGKMYLMGGLDTDNSGGSTYVSELVLDGSNADTFIANNSTLGTGTLTLKGYYCGNGNAYIENNLVVQGCDGSNKTGNRSTALRVATGNTYVSGSVTLSDYNAMYICKNASFSCEGDVDMACSIYNLGKLYILGDLNIDWSKTTYITDRAEGKEMKEGISLKNGDTEGTVDAYMYVGGTNTLQFYGYILNYGEIYSRAGMESQGYTSEQVPSELQDETAFINFKNAKAHFAGGVNLNSNSLYNGENSIFVSEGDFTYGICLTNIGDCIITGSVELNKDTKNSKAWRNSKSMSVMNGQDAIEDTGYEDAVLYIGGDLTLGASESGGESGSYFTMGKTYIGGDLNVYTNASNSYFRTAIWAYNYSNTFIGGDCFGGGGVATGNYSIFMAGGDFRSKRCVKINIEFFRYNTITEGQFYTYCDDNKSYQSYADKDEENYRSAYFYIGGNMLANTLGLNVKASTILTTIIPENNSRDLDIYSNSNIYIGGSLYAYSKVYMKQNVTLIVEGKKSLTEADTILDLFKSFGNDTIRVAIRNMLDDTDYKAFFYGCLDENICSRLYVNGSMYVKDTAKMRDMTKNYIYGNFKGGDYVEFGKSLLDDDEDRTQASVTESNGGKFWTKGDSLVKYTFANAGYMYVGGDFESGKYTKIYASTTMRVSGDFTSSKYVTLRHDAKVYVGKKLKAATSIEGGSYSEFHVAGSMQASTSWIKLRDCTTVAVGGNFTALDYIELGKYGDYTRTITTDDDGNKSVTEETSHGVTEGTEPEYDDSGEVDGGDDGTGGEAGESGDAETEDKNETETQSTDSHNTETELAYDDSDKATGGEFYIGQALASYTSNIYEYAYSRVLVGDYVFTPKYLTIRHNADMWVLPEAFENVTYMHHDYVSETDGTLWGNIKDKLNELSYNIQDTFSAKQGSIYSLGELTLNKNASILGTYDCLVLGQCVLRQDSLIYLGHDFTCTASELNVTIGSITGQVSYAGFDSKGTASSDSETEFPVVIYADNEINISTSVDMQLTYLIANKGDVNLYNAYSTANNAETNAEQLPNAIASYQGDINYFAMYGKIGALFYAPSGVLNLDGYYQEIWGCGIGNTVEVNAYYLNMHRFTNWRTMKLNMAESDDVYIISEDEYEEAADNVVDYSLDDSNLDSSSGGASLFFSRDVLDSIDGEEY